MADIPTPLLLSVGAAAAFIGLPRRSFERAQAAGRVGPEPVKIGTRRLYRSADLQDWVRQGCPSRDRWKDLKAKGVNE